ncbi:MAG: 4'-phosphopantetheinyl transferase superfamily protein [Candidatus Omnitrophica bacterium]|nr:4'-phosphopantetheinyl transferase superfamily protein [Candidatus Omnitrophota bacterium]MCM8831955.1 4'-phosphopantetheinyl transferase superfamily protein [Candidatus Omnitrophota bacterium]
MLNFSIDLESLRNYKDPAKVSIFLSKNEIKSKKNIISLVGKIAAKKAFFKCIEDISADFKKIEIKNSRTGRPYIEILNDELKKKLENKKIDISISHTKDIVVAICLIYE